MAQVLVNDTTLTTLADTVRENYFDVIKTYHTDNLTDDGSATKDLAWFKEGSGTAFTIEESDLPCYLIWYGQIDGCIPGSSTAPIKFYLNDVNVKDLENKKGGLIYDKIITTSSSSTLSASYKKYIYEVTEPGTVTFESRSVSSNNYGAYIALVKQMKEYTPAECLEKISLFNERTLVNNFCTHSKVRSTEFARQDIDVRTKLESVDTGGFFYSIFSSSNREGYDLSNTKIGEHGFRGCTFAEPELVKLPKSDACYSAQAFERCNFSEIVIPEGVTKIPYSCFQYATPVSGANIILPSTIKKIDGYSFNVALANITIKDVPASNITLTTYSFNASAGINLYVKEEYLEGYANSSTWKRFIKQILPYDTRDLESLTITGGSSSFYVGEVNTISFGIQYNKYNNVPEEQKGVVWSCSGGSIDENGVLTIDDSNSNYNAGDTIVVTATSKYNPSIQANYTITAEKAVNQITIDLNGQWIDSGKTSNENTVYKSNSNYHVASGIARARITMKKGYSSFTLYLRSYGESTYDYAWATKVNQAICTKTPGSSVPSYAVLNTKGSSSSSTYKSYTYTGLVSGDYIDIYYTKDSSGDSYDDRGYFYIGDSANYNIVVNA